MWDVIDPFQKLVSDRWHRGGDRRRNCGEERRARASGCEQDWARERRERVEIEVQTVRVMQLGPERRRIADERRPQLRRH